MALIDDINTSGASARTITVRGGFMQVLVNGTWNGATVSLQKSVGGSWLTVASYTDNAYDVVETVGSGLYRFNTVQDASAPVLVCDVTFDSSGTGTVE